MSLFLRSADSLSLGLFANYLGKLVVAFISLLSLPLLYSLLGTEGFGLFGFFYSIQALMGIMDFGLAGALQRDMARHAQPNALQLRRMREQISCTEKPVVLIVLMVMIALTVCAQFLANHWFQVQTIPISVVTECIMFMGLAAGAQLLNAFYLASLNGLRQFRKVNILQTTVALIRFPLVLMAAGWMSVYAAPIEQMLPRVFAIWACINVCGACLSRVLLMQNFQRMQSALPIDWTYLRASLRFGLSIACTTVLIMVFNQIDKLVASRSLSLGDFGHYAVIWSITEVLYLFYQPIYTSFLPIFSAQAALDDPIPTQESFKLAWDCMALATVPVAITLLVAPMEMVWLWTGQHEVALLWANNLRWAIGGALLNAFLFIPFAMQQGRGSLFDWVGILCVSLAVYAPACVWLMHFYGAKVGMAVWAVATLIMVMALMRKSFYSIKMPNVAVHASLSAIKTIFICGAGAALIYFLWPKTTTRFECLLLLGLLSCCMYVLALLTQRALYLRIRQGFRAWRMRNAAAASVL